MSKKTHTDTSASFSIVDFVIVLIAVSLIVGVVIRYDVVDNLFSKTSLVEAKVTFTAEAITENEADAFTENKRFYTEGGDLFGTLSTVSEPAKALMYIENSEGVLISYEHDSLLDVAGSFTCKVMPSENGYLLGGNRYIAAGSVFTVKSNGVSVKITVISITEIE